MMLQEWSGSSTHGPTIPNTSPADDGLKVTTLQSHRGQSPSLFSFVNLFLARMCLPSCGAAYKKSSLSICGSFMNEEQSPSC